MKLEIEPLDLRPDLLNYAASLGADSHTAEDLVQYAYLEYYDQKPSDNGISTWLKNIIKYTFIDSLRKMSPELEGEPEKFLAPAESDLSVALRELLVQLDPYQRRLIDLRLQGYTVDEVAELVAKPAGTLMRHYSKTIKTLRELNENSDQPYRPDADATKNGKQNLSGVC